MLIVETQGIIRVNKFAKIKNKSVKNIIQDEYFNKSSIKAERPKTSINTYINQIKKLGAIIVTILLTYLTEA